MYFYDSVKDDFPFGEILNGFSNFLLTSVIFFLRSDEHGTLLKIKNKHRETFC